jgi:sulfoxide reductase heme-binding subunit YedZ
MTGSQWVTRAVRPALWMGSTLPLLWLVRGAVQGELGTDPVETIQKVTGLSALSFLLGSLAVTPLRRLSGWNALIRLRRSLGVTAFGYALLHAFSYFVFDQELSPGGIAADVVKHPWVLAGFSAFALLIPLVATSTDGMVRRLGGKRWQRLQRLVYAAAILAVLHFLWLVKRDVTLPLYYIAALVVLLAVRLIPRRRSEAAAAALAGR